MRLGSAAAGALVLALSLIATPAAFAGGDMELGRYLASECVTCHRAATSASTIPNIFGMAEAHLTVLLKAYRGKELPNPAMQNVASRLTDEEIDALALYFSQTNKP